jgi:hypothetical protein
VVEYLFHFEQHLIHAIGFRKESARTGGERRVTLIGISKAAHEDDLEIRIKAEQFLYALNSIHAPHGTIHQHKVKGIVLISEQLDCFFPASSRNDSIAATLEHISSNLEQNQVIVNQEDGLLFSVFPHFKNLFPAFSVFGLPFEPGLAYSEQNSMLMSMALAE